MVLNTVVTAKGKKMKKIIRRAIDEDQLIDNLHPLLARIFASRGISKQEELELTLQSLETFHQLKDIDKACQRLYLALKNQENILFLGDFDADGATSTALGVKAMRDLGAKHVDYLVPNRFEYGYGLSVDIVELAFKTKKPSLIVTVDNGIASLDGVEKANSLGIEVIITDHHLSADTLPNAVAIVNPNRKDCLFKSKGIAGVGVIFYVMTAFRRYLIEHNYFIDDKKAPNMAQYLDLVALGTVADVVPLEQNNRILIAQGLARIRRGNMRPGIAALLKVARREHEFLNAADLGFSVGPRLNAAGRLDDMSLGIECLLSNTEKEALELAQALDNLNDERRLIEREMKQEALNVLSKLHLNEQKLPRGLCLYDKNFHQGVIGILAGRLKEQYHRPVVIFAKGDNDMLKGSARSIHDIHIRDLFDEIDKLNPGLIDKFGGHAMAAGLSIEEKKFSVFKSVFEEAVANKLSEESCVGVIYSDGELSGKDLTLDTANLINQAGPWGQHFPEPLFDNTFELLEQRLLSDQHLKMTLRTKDNGQIVDAIAFNVGNKVWPNHRAREVYCAYRLDINRYMGREKLQLIVENLEPA